MPEFTDDEYADAIRADWHRTPPRGLIRNVGKASAGFWAASREYSLALAPGCYPDARYAETLREIGRAAR